MILMVNFPLPQEHAVYVKDYQIVRKKLVASLGMLVALVKATFSSPMALLVSFLKGIAVFRMAKPIKELFCINR